MPISAIRLLGELALRVHDLQEMEPFYTDVVGLDLWGRPNGGSFLRVADGVDGHPQVLALFDRDTAVGQASTTLDHLTIRAPDQPIQGSPLFRRYQTIAPGSPSKAIRAIASSDGDGLLMKCRTPVPSPSLGS